MKYKWAAVGCGHIANEMAEALAPSGERFYGVYSRNAERANAFAKKRGVQKVYLTFDELTSDEEIDIVYIATPHNTHISFLEKALSAGKHVLCEKAITLNSDELEKAVELAAKHNVVLAEAMTVFHCPVYEKVEEILAEKNPGKLKMIQVNLGSAKEYDMENRFFNMNLAGGALLDIGVYALSFARRFLSEAPNEILSQMEKAETGADEQVSILLKNPVGEMATVTLTLRAKLPRTAVVAFENAYVCFDNYNRSNRAKIYYTDEERTEIVETSGNISPLAIEFADMEMAVSGVQNNMRLDYTCDVMRIMTEVRNEHGMFYPEEQN